MDWTIDLTSAILLTSLTGSILFLCWSVVAFVLDRLGFINIIFHAMKVVMPFWLFPLSFLILSMDNVLYDDWGGFLFHFTPLIAGICTVFCLVWLAGVIYNISRFILEVYRIKKIYKKAEFANCFCWHCFEDACRCQELNSTEFRVLYSTWDNSPKIFGLLHPTVILPQGTYTEDELEVIYTHELTHYLQKLLKLKHLTMIAYACNFLNPLIWLFGKQVHGWGEFACDNTTQIYIGSARYYFETLLFTKPEYREAYAMTRSNMVEKPCELETRILRIKRSDRDMSMKKRVLAGLTIGTMMVVSTVSVSAATVGIANAYMRMYDASVVEDAGGIDTQVLAEETMEYTADGLPEGVIEEVGEVIETYSARAAQAFEWDIKKNRSKRTPNFDAKTGQMITVTVVCSPSDAEIHVGIIKPDGSRLYAAGSGTIAHQFSVDTDGEYSVYVQNLSGDAITLSGSYLVTN